MGYVLTDAIIAELNGAYTGPSGVTLGTWLDQAMAARPVTSVRQTVLAGSVFGQNNYLSIHPEICATFEGANGDTSYTDYYGNDIVIVAGATISTAQFKFGVSSLRCPVSSGAIGAADTQLPLIPTSLWTIEFWAFVDNLSNPFYFRYTDAPTSTILGITVDAIGVLSLTLGSGVAPGDIANGVLGITTFPLNTWAHVALSFDGNAYRLYLDGLKQIEITSSVPVGSTMFVSYQLYAIWTTSSSNVYYDDFRFSSYCRYTADIENTPTAQIVPDTRAVCNGSSAYPVSVIAPNGVSAPCFKNVIDKLSIWNGLQAYATPSLLMENVGGVWQQLSTPYAVQSSSSLVGLLATWEGGSTGPIYCEAYGSLVTLLTFGARTVISPTQKKFGVVSLYTRQVSDIGGSASFTFPTTNFPAMWSIEFFVYLSQINVLHGLLGTLNNTVLLYVTTGNKISMSIGTSSMGWEIVSAQLGGTSLSATTWYHICLQFTGSTYRLYLNGTQEGATVTSSTAAGSPGTLVIGEGTATPIGGTAASYIDDFRYTPYLRYSGITSFTAPSAQLTVDANTGFKGSNAKTIMATFEGIDTQTYYADLYNNIFTWYNTTGNHAISTAHYKYGTSSLYINGAAASAIQTVCPTLPPTWTIQMWVCFTAHASIQTILTGTAATADIKLNLSTTQHFVIYLSSNNSTFNIANGTAGTATITTDGATFTHVAIVCDGTFYKIYVNGVQDISVTSSLALYQPPMLSLGIDRNISSTPMTGYIDDFNFEPTALYENTFTPPGQLTPNNLPWIDTGTGTTCIGYPGAWVATPFSVLGTAQTGHSNDRFGANYITSTPPLSTGNLLYSPVGGGLSAYFLADTNSNSTVTFANGNLAVPYDYYSYISSVLSWTGLLPLANNFIYVDYSGGVPVTGSSPYIPQDGQSFIGANAGALLAGFEGVNLITSYTDKYGTPYTFSTANAFISTDYSKFGMSSLRIAGTNGYVQCQCPPLPTTWTLEFWFRLDAISGNQAILAGGSTYDGFGVYHNATRLLYHLSSNGTSWNLASAATGTKTSWTQNIWYHFALVCDGTYYKAYVDGVLDYVFTAATPIIQPGYIRHGLWGDGSSYPTTGYFDAVRFTPYLRVSPINYFDNFTPPTAMFSTETFHFFNTTMYEMFYGNPTDGWTKCNRIFLGECATNLYNVTSTLSYAIQAMFTSADTTVPASGTYYITSFNHNIGTKNINAKLSLKCILAQEKYLPGDVIDMFSDWGVYSSSGIPISGQTGIRRNTAYHITGNSRTTILSALDGTNVVIIPANWKYVLTAQRAW
jgi:hypothetical protein